MVFEELKKRKMQALRDKNEVEKSILGVIIGELQKLPPEKITDDAVYNFIRKTIKANKDTIVYGGDRVALLEQENQILEGVLPDTLDMDQMTEKLKPLTEEIKAAKSEGQAIGIAMKLVKAEKLYVLPETTKEAVLKIRG